MSVTIQRRLPIGAEPCPEGTHFRVWAPCCRKLDVVINGSRILPLESEGEGYFSALASDAIHGTRYQFRLDKFPRLLPDPASRFQPDGPHGPSEVIDAGSFPWTDDDWRGLRMAGQVLYEMHIGTFTRDGTWRAALEYLPELRETGITVLEILPVAEFPGAFGWGYDGVDLFAPSRLYGPPDGFRLFVDRAHDVGLGVILDVVYNHLGPDGNYFQEFSDTYFSQRYVNEWGDPINFDGPGSGPVREFFIANARYWIDEFHLDGLRLDATQQTFDSSPVHVLREIAAAARDAAGGRDIIVIAESEPQRAELVRPVDRGGFGLDGVWNDDFHHTARGAMTGRTEAYYSDYTGSPQEFISAMKWGYLYQGQRSSWQKKRRGTAAAGVKPESFVNYIENHDQIANSVNGERIRNLTSPALFRAITTLLMLGPATPLLFQGQEYGASNPFLYFADHNPELALLVQKGRTEFLNQFPSIAGSGGIVAAPHDPANFQVSKLNHSERRTNSRIVALHRDLIQIRRSDPVFRSQRSDWMHGAVLREHAFVLRFFGEEHGDRLIVVNLGRDVSLTPVPEPLLAPPDGAEWRLLWSSESPQYGGCGREVVDKEGVWWLTAESVAVLRSEVL